MNTPRSPVHSYSKDGHMRMQNVSDPVYAPNSYGGPEASPGLTDDGGLWHSDGEMVRAAYTLRAEDDDWGQAGTMVRDVMDDAARERLVDNIVGHLLNGVSDLVLERAFEYWRNVDQDLGERVEAGVRARQNEKDLKAAQQANPARTSMQDHARQSLTRAFSVRKFWLRLPLPAGPRRPEHRRASAKSGDAFRSALQTRDTSSVLLPRTRQRSGPGRQRRR